MTAIPSSLQGVLWSKGVARLDLKQDKTYIVHQVLRFGSLDDIRWLIKTYDGKTLREEFCQHPKAIYSRPALNFVKNSILRLEKENLDETKYLQQAIY